MPKTTIKYLTDDELGRLLKQVKSKRDRAMILTAYTYGLRAQEVCSLQQADIDFDSGQIRIERLKGSNSHYRDLDRGVARVIKNYLKERGEDQDDALFRSKKGGAMSRVQFYRLFSGYAEAASIEPGRRNPHILKHSAAMHLLKKTNDVLFVKNWLGHRQIGNTLKYVELNDEATNRRMHDVGGMPVKG